MKEPTMMIDLTAAELLDLATARFNQLAGMGKHSEIESDALLAKLLRAQREAAQPTTDAMGAPVVSLNPVQTQAEGLTRDESMAAYKAVADKFRLRAASRSRLDRSPSYSAILNAAHQGRWNVAETALYRAGIME